MANILVVDDEIEVGAVIRRVLERAGHAVTVTNNAATGLDAVVRQLPDVVITDVIMPRVNGVELIKVLRERYPSIRVIAISGGGSFGPLAYKPEAISTHAFLAAAREAGAQEILTKPFDLTDLLAAVRRQLPN
jgi:CheY-like chemotaxis protein